MPDISETTTAGLLVDLISDARLNLGIAQGQGLGAMLLTLIAVLLIVWKRGGFLGKLIASALARR